MRHLINSLSATLSRFAERWVPDPMLIAVLLTAMTLVISTLCGDSTVRYRPLAIFTLWSEGLWKLLPFAMQMCLVLITGHALASAPLIRRVVKRLSGLAQSSSAAIILTALTAMGAGLLNWGLGLIVGAFMAREVGEQCSRRGIAVHYPLLGAAGYTGLLVWHGGLSGTAPLKVSQLKDMREISHLDQVIPLTETLFSATNLILTLGLLILVPLLLRYMNPEELQGAERWISIETTNVSADRHKGDSEERLKVERLKVERLTPAAHLENHRSLALLLGAFIIGAFLLRVKTVGIGHLNLNMINLGALGLGLLLHPSLSSYTRAAKEAAMSTSGIILQFPLYSGIMAVMSGSGMTAALATMVANVASADSLSSLTFMMAGVVNLFVPSGGGQWAVQGPLVLSSASSLQASLGEAVIAFAHGDAWTNMLQPFWALPLLAITGLQAREIVGYTAALMIALTPWYLFVFWLF